MQNKRMQEKIKSGKAIDLSKNNINENGYYILDKFVQGVDYCDKKKEAWIWSIGKHYETGQILAAKSAIFYQHPDFECLFLR